MYDVSIHVCLDMLLSKFDQFPSYCWWLKSGDNQLRLVVQFPLFIGFQKHPRWWFGIFSINTMFCFPAMKWDIHGKDEMGKGLSNGGKWWKGVFVISVRQKVSQIIFERAPNGDGAPFWCFFFRRCFPWLQSSNLQRSCCFIPKIDSYTRAHVDL